MPASTHIPKYTIQQLTGYDREGDDEIHVLHSAYNHTSPNNNIVILNLERGSDAAQQQRFHPPEREPTNTATTLLNTTQILKAHTSTTPTSTNFHLRVSIRLYSRQAYLQRCKPLIHPLSYKRPLPCRSSRTCHLLCKPLIHPLSYKRLLPCRLSRTCHPHTL
jgi:hypothetical protein